MRQAITYKGARYVQADGIAGFSEDLNLLCDSLPTQIQALLTRAQKLGLKKTALELQRLLTVVKAFSKKSPPDLDITQEMSAVAENKHQVVESRNLTVEEV